MMEPTVKDGARDRLVAEDLVPGTKALLLVMMLEPRS
jgi:hypothetical protein